MKVLHVSNVKKAYLTRAQQSDKSLQQMMLKWSFLFKILTFSLKTHMLKNTRTQSRWGMHIYI